MIVNAWNVGELDEWFYHHTIMVSNFIQELSSDEKK
jgi:hypothetical protein